MTILIVCQHILKSFSENHNLESNITDLYLNFFFFFFLHKEFIIMKKLCKCTNGSKIPFTLKVADLVKTIS